MTEKMKTALAEEIDLINSWLAYEDADELEYMDNLSDAVAQIEGMNQDRDPDDPLPAGLLDPATMLTVWNYCVAQAKARAAQAREERERPNREYLLKVTIDGETSASIETGRKIAELYETDRECGYMDNMEVWDIRSDPVKIDLEELVGPILENKRWMEQEYRNYCDAVNEYGYDFEGRDE